MRGDLFRFWLLSMAALLLPGCTAHIRSEAAAKYTDGPMPRVDITPGPQLAGRVDRASHMGDTCVFPTGERVKEVFVGHDGCRWKIELLSADLNWQWRDEFPLPIWHTTANYRISCILSNREGTKVPLTASGAGKAGLDYERAISLAVNKALRDLAMQAKAVITP